MTSLAVSRTTVLLALDLIDPPALDARIERDPEKLEELARDILRRGLIEPIKVVAHGARYEVVDGQRRFLATKSAGLESIECFVFATPELAHEGVKYAANIFREDMSPAEEAVMFHALLQHECGGDIEQLAVLTGKRISYLDHRLALLAGDELVFAAVKDRTITIGVASALNKLPAEDYRRYYLTHAIASGATVGVVRAWVTEWQALYGTERPARPAAAPPSGPVVSPPLDVHYCAVCRTSDRRYIPEQVSIHTHCKLAVLEKLLDAYHGQGGSPA
jgi:ParB/RepB/Spo0J family partition protein